MTWFAAPCSRKFLNYISMHHLGHFDPRGRHLYIEDLTDIIVRILLINKVCLNNSNHTICVFNPSIAGEYTTARVIGLKPDAQVPPEFTFKNPFQSDIPWDQMVDGTIILKGNSFLNFFPNKVDMRLMKFGSKIMVIFNEYVLTKIPKMNIYKFENFPGARTRVYVELSTLEGDHIAEPIQHPCADQAAPVEKNWSMWMGDGGSLMISYSLQPKHVFMEPDASAMHKCSLHTDDTEFEFPPGVHISLGTPALQYEGDTMLAVGHAKILLSKIAPGEYSFPVELALTHPDPKRDYKYFMFLYKFNRTTGKIIAYSGFFIPWNGEPHKIFFPTGLDYHDSDKFIIAYGVDDSRSNLLFLDRGAIEDQFRNKITSPTVAALDVRHDPPRNYFVRK